MANKNRRGVDMNKVQQKKWISVLGMGVFILTMLYICTLYSDEDKRNVAKNAAVTDKMQQNTDNDLPADFPKDLFFNSGVGGWRPRMCKWMADVFTIKQRWLIYRRVFRF